jgi:hypothetical protein
VIDDVRARCDLIAADVGNDDRAVAPTRS